MGQEWDTIKYARWESYATGWTVDQAVEGAADVEYRGASIVHNPDNDKSHFFYSHNTATNEKVLHKALTNANSLDSTADEVQDSRPSTFAYIIGPGAWYNPSDAINSRVTIGWKDLEGDTADFLSSVIDDDGTPSAEVAVNDTLSPKSNSNSYVLKGINYQSDDIVVEWWAQSSTEDLYISTSYDGGTCS